MAESTDWDLESFEDAEESALLRSGETGKHFIPIDRGEGVAPRFSVVLAPPIGSPVSYAFNGDYYPDGYITNVSKTLKVITTTTGSKYYRKNLTAQWMKGGTWTMVYGHTSRLNPHF